MTLLSLTGLLMTGAPALAQEVSAGTLVVEAPVEGAVVHIDYEEHGVTPLSLELPPGPYTLRIAADGYAPFVRKVDIISDKETRVDAELISGPGSVEFYTQPLGATITLDGEELMGMTPIRLPALSDGENSYTLSTARHEPLEGSFTYTQGQNILIVEELESSEGRFEITSNPQGAEVWLDGEPVGVTPLSLQDIPAAEHSLMLKHRGHAAVIRQVDTSDGSKGELTVKLPKEGCRQKLRASEDAVFRIDGAPVGEGRSVSLLLAKGSYDLSVEAASGVVLERSISVPGRGSQLHVAELGGEDAAIVKGTPLTQHWAFWTGVGLLGAGGGTGVLLATRPEAPEPLPEGDEIVQLP